MDEFSVEITIPVSLDALGRIINVLRRSKIKLEKLEVDMDTTIYRLKLLLRGEHNEAMWLIAKLDRLPEVINIKFSHGQDLHR